MFLTQGLPAFSQSTPIAAFNTFSAQNNPFQAQKFTNKPNFKQQKNDKFPFSFNGGNNQINTVNRQKNSLSSNQLDNQHNNQNQSSLKKITFFKTSLMVDRRSQAFKDLQELQLLDEKGKLQFYNPKKKQLDISQPQVQSARSIGYCDDQGYINEDRPSIEMDSAPGILFYSTDRVNKHSKSYQDLARLNLCDQNGKLNKEFFTSDQNWDMSKEQCQQAHQLGYCDQNGQLIGHSRSNQRDNGQQTKQVISQAVSVDNQPDKDQQPNEVFSQIDLNNNELDNDQQPNEVFSQIDLNNNELDKDQQPNEVFSQIDLNNNELDKDQQPIEVFSQTDLNNNFIVDNQQRMDPPIIEKIPPSNDTIIHFLNNSYKLNRSEQSYKALFQLGLCDYGGNLQTPYFDHFTGRFNMNYQPSIEAHQQGFCDTFGNPTTEIDVKLQNNQCHEESDPIESTFEDVNNYSDDFSTNDNLNSDQNECHLRVKANKAKEHSNKLTKIELSNVDIVNKPKQNDVITRIKKTVPFFTILPVPYFEENSHNHNIEKYANQRRYIEHKDRTLSSLPNKKVETSQIEQEMISYTNVLGLVFDYVKQPKILFIIVLVVLYCLILF